jgi:tetratricopeptide (TPR) repeat protein
MLNKIFKYKIWFSLGILSVLGIVFFGAMLRFIGYGEKKAVKGSLYETAKQNYLNASYKNSVSIYEKLLVLEPENGNAILDAAIIYDDYLNADERAIELYKRYLELFPKTKKKKLIDEWIKNSAQESLGVKEATDEEKIKQFETDIKNANKEKDLLKQQIEDLSSKLFTIQSDFQKEKQLLQAENERLSGELTSARTRIGKLSKELSSAESAKKKLMEKLASSEKREKTTTRENTKQTPEKTIPAGK